MIRKSLPFILLPVALAGFVRAATPQPAPVSPVQPLPPPDPRATATEAVRKLIAAQPAEDGRDYLLFLLKGKHRPESLEESRMILDRAGKGDIRALYHVGLFGVESGDKSAGDYLADAANAGCPEAVLARALAIGETEPERAARMLVPFVEKGDIQARVIDVSLRLRSATDDTGLRDTIALLKKTGLVTKTYVATGRSVQDAARELLTVATLRLKEPTAAECGELLETSQWRLSPEERAWLLAHVSGTGHDRKTLGNLRERLRRNDATIPNIPGKKLTTRNERIRRLRDRLPAGERAWIARLYFSRFGDHSIPGEDRSVVVRDVLSHASAGDAWAKEYLMSEVSESYVKNDPELTRRIREILWPSPPENVLLGHVRQRMGLVYERSDSKTPFADLDPVLAPFDAGIGTPENDGTDAGAFRDALRKLEPTPGDAGALATIRRLADSGVPYACHWLAADTPDFPAKIRLLENAAKGGSPYACDRLARALSSPQNPAPDYARAIGFAKKGVIENAPDAGFLAVQLVRSHRELYVTEELYRNELRAVSMRAGAGRSYRERQRPRTSPAVAGTPAPRTDTRKNNEEVVRTWLGAKADAGDADAAALLNGTYANETRPDAEGIRRLKQAAGLGDTDALHLLGGATNLPPEERLDYLRRAAAAGFTADYVAIARFEDNDRSQDPEERRRRRNAANTTLAAGAKAGDLACRIRLARRIASAPDSRSNDDRRNALLEAEKILLADDDSDPVRKKAISRELIAIYLNESYRDDAGALAKITALDPDSTRTGRPPEHKDAEALKLLGSAVESRGRNLAGIVPLQYAAEKGSPDAAYLLWRFGDSEYLASTGKTAAEWLKIAYEQNYPEAIIERAGEFTHRGKADPVYLRERDDVIARLKPLAKNNLRAADRLATIYLVSGDNAKAFVVMRRMGVLGDPRAMMTYAMFQSIPADPERARQIRGKREFAGIKSDINEGYAWFRIIAGLTKKEEGGRSEFSQAMETIKKNPDFDASKAKAAEDAIRREMAETKSQK